MAGLVLPGPGSMTYESLVAGLASDASTETVAAKLLTTALGLNGEAGEVADIVKKVVYHGLPLTAEVEQRLWLELGDILWYVAFAAHFIFHKGVLDVAQANAAKLLARYPDGKFNPAVTAAKEAAKS